MNLKDFSIRTRLLATTACALGLMILFVLVALNSLNSITDLVEHITGNNVRKTELAVDMRSHNMLVDRHVRTALLADDRQAWGRGKEAVDAEMAAYMVSAKEIEATLRSDKGRALFARIAESRLAAQGHLKTFFDELLAGRKEVAARQFEQALQPAMAAWYKAAGDFIELQKENTEHDSKRIEQLSHDTRNLMLGMIVLAILVMVPSGIWVSGQISAPLNAAIAIADAVAEGRLDNAIAAEGKDETAHLLSALSTMQDDLRARRDADQLSAQEAARLQMALASSATPLTISDERNVLVYMNDAATALWRSMEPAMAQRVPGFSVDAMRNHSLVSFFDDEEAKTIYRQELTAPRTLEIAMCGRSLLVTATPVRDAAGHYLGRASQWIDRTNEVAIEQRVSDIIVAATQGDFSRRIDVADTTGFFRQISEGINQLLDANSRSLGEVGAMLNRLAKGDLTRKIDGNYSGMLADLKEDANSTVENLEQIIQSIKGASDAINTAAKEIAAGNQDLSERTEQQASSLEETASSMEQLTSTVRQNADNARQANELASQAKQVAVNGGEVVGKVVQTMSAIHQSSSKIADIIGVIDGIAFQTNILALNAAVEAARAGEQGRGFAVVASEVRNLAQRSAAAAKEIKGLISDSVDKVEVGNKLVNQAGRTMDDVVASIGRVARIMADISDATTEQSQGIEQVTLAIGQMDEVTQQNAALVEQAAAAAESLEEQAIQLTETVAVFALPGERPTARAALAPPPAPARKVAALSVQEPVRLAPVRPEAGKIAPPLGGEDEWAEF